MSTINKDPPLALNYLNPDSIRWMHKRTRHNVTSTAHLQQTVALDLLSMFEGLDLDGSGQINIKDLRQAVKYVAEVSDISFDPVSLSDFFESMDADESGTIDIKEFVAGMITHPDSNEVIRTIQSLQTVFSSFANQLRRQRLYGHMSMIDLQSQTCPLKPLKLTKQQRQHQQQQQQQATNTQTPTTASATSVATGNSGTVIDTNYETNKLRDFYSIFSVQHFQDKAEYTLTDTTDVKEKYSKFVNTAEHQRLLRIERERARDAALVLEGKKKVNYHPVAAKEEPNQKYDRLRGWFFSDDDDVATIAAQAEAEATEKAKKEAEQISKDGSWIRQHKHSTIHNDSISTNTSTSISSSTGRLMSTSKSLGALRQHSLVSLSENASQKSPLPLSLTQQQQQNGRSRNSSADYAPNNSNTSTDYGMGNSLFDNLSSQTKGTKETNHLQQSSLATNDGVLTAATATSTLAENIRTGIPSYRRLVDLSINTNIYNNNNNTLSHYYGSSPKLKNYRSTPQHNSSAKPSTDSPATRKHHTTGLKAVTTSHYELTTRRNHNNNNTNNKKNMLLSYTPTNMQFVNNNNNNSNNDSESDNNNHFSVADLQSWLISQAEKTSKNKKPAKSHIPGSTGKRYNGYHSDGNNDSPGGKGTVSKRANRISKISKPLNSPTHTAVITDFKKNASSSSRNKKEIKQMTTSRTTTPLASAGLSSLTNFIGSVAATSPAVKGATNRKV